jgi:hypothetical protein
VGRPQCNQDVLVLDSARTQTLAEFVSLNAVTMKHAVF